MNINRILHNALGPLFALGLMAYFGYHVIQGDRGMLSWLHLRRELKIALEEEEKLRRKREILENRANRLTSKQLDLDLLEERSQLILNQFHPDSVVIFDSAPIVQSKNQ